MSEFFEPNSKFKIHDGKSLPHWSQDEKIYFVTFRTTDSIPIELSRRWSNNRIQWLKSKGINFFDPNWKAKFESLPLDKKKEFHNQFSKGFFKVLDFGYGECLLRKRAISNIVKEALLYFDQERYEMGDFVIMPNHVHLLVRMFKEREIQKQCSSWKRFTARKINELKNRKGRFWQAESFDHIVRSKIQLERYQQYIRDNPAHLKSGEYVYYRSPQADFQSYDL